MKKLEMGKRTGKQTKSQKCEWRDRQIERFNDQIAFSKREELDARSL